MSAVREQLILEHLPQVRWIAASIHERLPSSISEEDLVSTGIVGLIQAIDRFDPNRSVSLRTFAEIRIRGAILDSIRGLDGVDPRKRGRIRLVEEAIGRLRQEMGTAPGEQEIAAALGLTLETYQQWLTELRGVRIGSLDSAASPDADSGLIAYLADETQEDPSVRIEKSEMRQLLAEGVRCLPQTEQLVLDLYFRQELTLAEVGQVLGIHLTRVSQIKVQAVLRLRSFLDTRLKRRTPLAG